MTQHHLKKRSEVHLARKFWHFSGVIFIAVCYHNLSHSTAIYIISLATSIFVIFDLLRLQIPRLNSYMLAIFHPFMRESERHGTAGTTYLLLGATILITLFPFPVVILSLLFLAVADPMASYIGIRFGRDRIIGKKSLQGTFAAFICCASISATYYFTHNLMTERLFVVSVISGLVGALSELIPIGNIDDNLSFPLMSAIGLWSVFYLFGGF